MSWNWKNLFKPDSKLLGLDIGSTSVKIIQLDKNNDNFTVTAAWLVDIPEDIYGDEDQNEIDIVQTIRQCHKLAGEKTQLAVCSVCGPDVAVRKFDFPVLPPEDIEGAVELEASQVCPFNIEQGTVDYQMIKSDENNMSGVLVAATNDLIEKKKNLAERASIETVFMDVDGLALLNCFKQCQETKQDETTIILNVGSTFTTLAIAGSSGLPFIRDIAYGGNDIIKRIARDNDVSTEIVRDILFGSGQSSDVEFEFSESLNRAGKKLVTDVTETLRYHITQQNTAPVERVFVCGGFALAKGFVEMLDNSLPASVILWNPFEKMQSYLDPACEALVRESGPALAVAAGLAMRSI